MSIKSIIIIFGLLFSLSSSATTFFPVSLEQQVGDSDGIVQAIYLGKNYKKITDGHIVTEASFKILKSSGLSENSIVNKNSFKVYYPGGVWMGMVYQVAGTPHFRDKEEVILFLRKKTDGFYIKSQGLGVYRIKKVDHKIVYQSTIFPNHPQLGSIDPVAFNNMLNDKFGGSFKMINRGKVRLANKTKANKGRVPASKVDRQKAGEPLSMFWLAAILFALMLSSLYFLNTRKR